MSNMRESRISLGMRQVDVQRRNLVQMCRLTVKSLIDKSSFEPVDDNSDELVNFFAVMEQLLLHRIKPQKSWFGSPDSNHYWDYIKVACRKLSNSCITNIESIENIKTARGKGRAWLRVALMEKRLSEYFSNALSQPRVTKKFYLEGSVMLSEDSGMLCGTLLGLNSIDFSFCLKGDNLELMGPLVIDYSPYLLFYHSDESMAVDDEDKLTNSNIGSSIMSEVDLDEATWSEKYQRLEQKYKNITEQKGYLEELVRLRQSQLDEATRQRHQLIDTLEHYESESRSERQQLEGVIIELQGQLSAVKDQLKRLQSELASLRARVLPNPDNSDRTALAMREITDEQTLRLPRHLLSNQESDVQSQTSSEISTHLSAEPRSVLTQSVVKEETQSLVPLAGSFTSEVSFRSGDLQMSALPKTFGDTVSDNGAQMKTSVENLNMVPVQISGSDVQDPLSTAEEKTGKENGNTASRFETRSDSDGDSPEVRSSPDGEVGDEDKTLAKAIASGLVDKHVPEDPKSGDESSDDGRAPPVDMPVEETSSDNSNGEWTLLPRSGEQQDQSSAEELAVPDRLEDQQDQSSAEELAVPDRLDDQQDQSSAEELAVLDRLEDQQDQSSAEELGVTDEGVPDAESPQVLSETENQNLPPDTQMPESNSIELEPEGIHEHSG